MNLLGTPFRPFFFGGAALAVAAMSVWAAIFSGFNVLPPSAMPMVQWHAHEMLFGFTAAVIAGFLLTAVQNWTKRTTVGGVALGGVFALWVIGRITAWVDFGAIGSLIDSSFLFVVAAIIARPLIAAGSKRNYSFIGLLVAMGVIDLAGHFEIMPSSFGNQLTLDLIVIILAIIGGRIIPLFTKNAVPQSGATKQPAVDKLALGLTWALLAFDAFVPFFAPVIALAAGLAHLARMRTWGSAHTLKSPILVILHLGYFWIGVALVLRGLTFFGVPIPPSAALHALTVGGIGTLTLAMITRVSLGHTGRKIIAHPVTVVAYGLMKLATVLRIAAAFGANTLVGAAVLFALSFLCFLGVYTTILFTPRADGKPG